MRIKLSEMYSNFNFKSFVWSSVGVFIYLFLYSCLTAHKICSFNFLNRSLQNCISLFILSVFEEIFFRGCTYTAFLSVLDKLNIKSRKVSSIMLTNLFFAIFHLQTYIIIYNYNFIQTLGTFISIFGVNIFLLGLYFRNNLLTKISKSQIILL